MKDNVTKLYVVKILISKTKVRMLYFKHQSEAEEWSEILRQVVGIQNLTDFYELGKVLG